jgi:hypothetical protein
LNSCQLLVWRIRQFKNYSFYPAPPAKLNLQSKQAFQLPGCLTQSIYSTFSQLNTCPVKYLSCEMQGLFLWDEIHFTGPINLKKRPSVSQLHIFPTSPLLPFRLSPLSFHLYTLSSCVSEDPYVFLLETFITLKL